MTKKELLFKMHGQRVKREYLGIYTVDDVDKMRQEIKEKLKQANIDPSLLEENDMIFSLNNAKIWYKPKCKNGYGIFEVRSKDYTFLLDGQSEKCYGSIPKGEYFKMLPDEEIGFIVIYSIVNHQIKYTLCKEGE